ncbi:MAG: hypothetical protein DIJKHBIC_02655 [Thermoanaerobaculia bacterium]|nr:hypothetical protein [Thermoanaerobaculia bacterium]
MTFCPAISAGRSSFSSPLAETYTSIVTTCVLLSFRSLSFPSCHSPGRARGARRTRGARSKPRSAICAPSDRLPGFGERASRDSCFALEAACLARWAAASARASKASTGPGVERPECQAFILFA